MALGTSIAAAEKRGFSVHALEVWQKSSHVKRAGGMPQAQGQIRPCWLFLKYSLSKIYSGKIIDCLGERSAFFVVIQIEVYIIIIMGQLKY